ncbi:PP2C family protein-serine/threonine phosphatase [Mycobacterium bourgelatii]|uniref:Protein phosphatase n=1 Tax=Mycobacterium bourgelatii TaxID=1273442 RepID=A0A7I9YHG7_MYCBU|nr:protein phosphatase 2C domain-containing protein [Mycobacterium bourgelatii]MCV6976696.1 serine/threonine-protein phosphatase [Mycobacterium bourgelatii]GFG87982.1 protein phosphatase [Mycobacterium bourgelatii]
MLNIGYSALSDVGCVRSDNQDRWGSDEDQFLFMVADGVGGSRDGALAAHTMVEKLPGYVAHHLPIDERDGPDAPERLARAVSELSDDLHTTAQKDARYQGANSTLVAVVIAGTRALVAHLGDSRAYLLRERPLKRLTRDHTLVQALVEAKQVDAADTGKHRARSIVTKYMGMRPPAKADGSAVELQAGDRILLCSDGLHGVVNEASIAQILEDNPDPGYAAAALIGAARDAGGPDNITALVINV